MGIELQAWAWQQRVGDPSRKLLLVKLAETANEETGETWWRLRLVAERCEMSLRTARRHLAALVKAGLINSDAMFRKDGSQTSNMIRFTPVDAQFLLRVNPPPVTGDRPPGHERPAPRSSVTGTPVTGDRPPGHERPAPRSPVTAHEPKQIPNPTVREPLPKGTGGKPPEHSAQVLTAQAALKLLMDWLESEPKKQAVRKEIPGSNPVRHVNSFVTVENPRPPADVESLFIVLGGRKRMDTWSTRPQDRTFFIDQFLKQWRKSA